MQAYPDISHPLLLAPASHSRAIHMSRQHSLWQPLISYSGQVAYPLQFPVVLVQSSYTREHKEATQALLKGFVGDIVEGVASSRNLPEDKVCKHHVTVQILSQAWCKWE